MQDYDWRSLIAYAKDHGGYKGCSYQIETDSEIDEYDFFKPLPHFFFLSMASVGLYGTEGYLTGSDMLMRKLHWKRQHPEDTYIKYIKHYHISKRRFSSLTVA
jgi:hypothetical protein